MVKGLLIRQVLMVINIALVLVVAYIMYLAGVQMFGGRVDVNPLDGFDASSAGGAITIAAVKPRTEYDSVVNGRLFGAAGSVAAPVTDVPPPVSDVIEPTSFQGKLLATVASYPTDPLATAIIDNPAATTPSKTSTYYLGQMVTDTLKLIEVHRRQVILLNTAKNAKEGLKMEPLGNSSSPSALAKNLPGGRAAKLASAGGGDGSRVTVERAAVMEELNSYDYQDLMAQLSPEFVKDESGNITGVTSASLSSLNSAKQAGLQDNDVIQAVNGVTIDSEQKIGEIAAKVGTAGTIRLSILRNGKPQMIAVNVQ